jgi:hypothetical protein
MATECYYHYCAHHGTKETPPDEGPFCFHMKCLATPEELKVFAQARMLEEKLYKMQNKVEHWREARQRCIEDADKMHAEIKQLRLEHKEYRETMLSENRILQQQRDGLRDAARELLARMDSSPERILLEAAIIASEDK